MKKPNLTKKLTLSRETLRMLADSDLKEVAGGHSGNEATKCTRCQTCTI
ncbi:MAG TPA: class I lanthipeptide [Thermoanaerobaculia bacterium]|nr:class I lanthipeptide [Thermoanaerobaculia bacterium]